jgi:MFS family permease
MDAIALSWVATAYLLTAAIFLIPLGKIADIYGGKQIYLYGIALFSFVSLAMTMVPSTEIVDWNSSHTGYRKCHDLRNQRCYCDFCFPLRRAWESYWHLRYRSLYWPFNRPFPWWCHDRSSWLEKYFLRKRTYWHHNNSFNSLETQR